MTYLLGLPPLVKSEPNYSGVSMVPLAARRATDKDTQKGRAFTAKGACGATRIIN